MVIVPYSWSKKKTKTLFASYGHIERNLENFAYLILAVIFTTWCRRPWVKLMTSRNKTWPKAGKILSGIVVFLFRWLFLVNNLWHNFATDLCKIFATRVFHLISRVFNFNFSLNRCVRIQKIPRPGNFIQNSN